MRIKIASHSGFCFGVKRAINIAENTLKRSGDKNNIYSLNPIIHNPQVVEELSKKGLRVLRDPAKIKKGIVIISSHGNSVDVIGRLKKKGIRIVDATCPFVKHAQDIVKRLKKEDYKIIIAGDKKHP
ncbi:MAG: bifunctional 4-hydroxy-3-methylbut-2-enyl diphosphate reductase/30S ribosomal protein S1, partial [Candidatus Omnitrophica bacterium]|nr:bifunctional 4-hydroxy-3-methylbut-2-enyl diphosphate reductase/30S ribosomal protein S1 [Candidatus Omnitrophota bacterium]